MFSFMERLRSIGQLFGGGGDEQRSEPRKADRPPELKPAGPAGNQEAGAGQQGAAHDLFDGMIDQVSEEVKEVAAPAQIARFEALRDAAPTEGREQSADSEWIDEAIADSRAAGGSRVDQILAGARADEGNVTFDGNGFLTGQERLIDMMRDTAGSEITGKNLQGGSGKVNNGKTSWCGIWATDIWRRAGVPVKWDLSKGTIVDEDTGKPLKQEAINASKQTDLAKIQPGDIITIQTLPKPGARQDVPPELQGTVPKNLNHHAIVASTVYTTADGKSQLTVPPDQPPEGGKIIGYNVQEGNNPQAKTDDEGNRYFDSIHSNFVPARLEEKTDGVGNKYVQGIASRIALPEEKPAETSTGPQGSAGTPSAEPVEPWDPTQCGDRPAWWNRP